MKIITSLFVLFVFASVGLSADDARKRQEDDVREAVFRWQFEHNASYQQRDAGVYFLEVGEKEGDPSDEFIKRFAGNKPPVRKRSECSVNMRRSVGVSDKKTGEKGLILSIRKIEWKSDTEVDVQGGYYEHGLSSSGNTYTLKKEKGKWKVTNDKLRGIS